MIISLRSHVFLQSFSFLVLCDSNLKDIMFLKQIDSTIQVLVFQQRKDFFQSQCLCQNRCQDVTCQYFFFFSSSIKWQAGVMSRIEGVFRVCTSFLWQSALCFPYMQSLKNPDIPVSFAGFDSSSVELLQKSHFRFTLFPGEAKYNVIPKCAACNSQFAFFCVRGCVR